MERRALCTAFLAASALLAALSMPAQAASLYQPGLGSILKAARPYQLNASAPAPAPAPGAHSEGAPLSVYSANAKAVAACLPLSVKFYDAQRSGRVPADEARVSWRTDSGLYDEVLGGFYDAGDYVKFVWPQAFSVAMLAWIGLEYPGSFQATNSYGALLSNVRWGADFLLRCAANAPASMVAAVGDPDIDHQFWDVAPLQVDQITRDSRKAVNVTAGADLGGQVTAGADLGGQVAGALAAASMLFMGSDAAYAAKLLDGAQRAYAFAQASNGAKYTCAAATRRIAVFYGSYSIADDLAWGAMWLYKATGLQMWLDTATHAIYKDQYTTNDGAYPWYFSYDNTALGAMLLHAKAAPQSASPSYLKYHFTTDVLQYITQPGHTTAAGLFWQNDISPWFSVRAGLSAAFTSLLYVDSGLADAGTAAQLEAFAKTQLDYALGNNPAGVSYAAGCGVPSYVTAQHHRGATGFPPDCSPLHACPSECTSSACPNGRYLNQCQDTPATNMYLLEGALAGGPNNGAIIQGPQTWNQGSCEWSTTVLNPDYQQPSDSWANVRCDYQRNEVSLDANVYLGPLHRST
ncbi:hypothetical protein WJX81_007858 [Elliptochloris bilobata]|uniref:cellulase n=1 Tax=Elliptochloris bilobata TaxID=381761 RepID=A0AAW1S720_9CHLO